MKCTVTVRDGGSVKADILVQFFSKKEMKRDAAKVLAGLGIIASPDGDFKA
ncbi:MAG: hypothetical protein HGA14_01205, partial [Chlorobaculum sp.]|nr:hypothetical protein [Chlorobaculum sp.]